MTGKNAWNSINSEVTNTTEQKTAWYSNRALNSERYLYYLRDWQLVIQASRYASHNLLHWYKDTTRRANGENKCQIQLSTATSHSKDFQKWVKEGR